ncbi:hypothetical protein [Paraburkholderia terrae]|uniref:hypothetical protein n=1 Tax=Paraburkholderia terrae TaxID=311230 RepID=UPI00206F1014|nr:hypothetical protein [Paraburkholderia terrae]BDC46157.1 hypothetical protein PTKU15_94540 [Paraburkholderia terrae]
MSEETDQHPGFVEASIFFLRAEQLAQTYLERLRALADGEGGAEPIDFAKMEESRLIVARLFQLVHAGRMRILGTRNENDERLVVLDGMAQDGDIIYNQMLDWFPPCIMEAAKPAVVQR